MKPFQTINSGIRRLSIILIIAALVSAFLFLYYYKYIPDNRDRLQRQGFLILQQQEEGIGQSIDDFKNFFKSKKEEFFEKYKQIPRDTDIYNEKPLRYCLSYKKYKGKKGNDLKLSEEELKNPVLNFDLNEKNEISFNFLGPKWDTVKFIVSINKMFEKILVPIKPDNFQYFFESHFIICQHHADKHESGSTGKEDKKTGKSEESDHDYGKHILYHSPELSISEKLQEDTIGKMLGSAQFSKIIDLKMNGNNYKAFMLPFQLEHNTFILTGLIPENEYKQRMQNIPVSTVSSVIIIFVFILICMPYAKVFFISREEKFGIKDIVFLGASMFVGSAILLVIIQQVLMQTGSVLRTREELISLGEAINKNFHSEISRACRELKYFDSSLKQKIDSNKLPKDTGYINKDSLLIYNSHNWTHNPVADSGYLLPFPDTPLNPYPYQNYTMLHWANDSGRQIYKRPLNSSDFTFNNINERKYLKDVINNQLFIQYGASNQVDSFAVQPVYSMTTNLFEADISIRSRLSKKDSTRMGALSTQLYSVINTIFPAGYGFYIIDEDGLILFQSDGTVTLKANFFKWINDSRELEYFCKNRQSGFINKKYVNDKQYSLFIKPVDNLPWHIVVYKSNEHAISSIMHVSAFTLFFLMVYFPLIFLFCAVAWKKTNYFTLLNEPIYQYNWLKQGNDDKVKPGNDDKVKPDKAIFFKKANIYLIGNFLFSIFFISQTYKHSVIWFIGIVSPVITLWILYLLYRHIMYSKPVGLQILKDHKKLLTAVISAFNFIPVLFLVVLDIAYYRIEPDKNCLKNLFWFEGLSILLPFIFTLFLKPEKHSLPPADEKISEPVDEKKSSQKQYPVFWFLCILTISLFPVHCFFQYAQEKEISLLTKNRQLSLAQKIEERLSKFDWFKNALKVKNININQQDSIMYHLGVYTLKSDCIKESKSNPTTLNARSSEPYDTILQTISWNYGLFDKFIAFQNKAEDNQWVWNDSEINGQNLSRLSYRLSPQNKNSGIEDKVQSLTLTSSLPGILYYFGIDNFTAGVLLFLFSFLLLGILFNVIKNIANRFFPTRSFETDMGYKDDSRDYLIRRIGSCGYYSFRNKLKKIISVNNMEDEKIAKSLYEQLWQKEYDCQTKNRANIKDLEETILRNQHYLEDLYIEIWKSCSEEEKYFLYDLSLDGFINYKNTRMIQQLLYKGLLEDIGDGLRIMSVSFRNYILDKRGSEDIQKMKEKFKKKSSWSNFRTPVLIIITAIGSFLFITQQDLLQRVGALIPTLSGLIGLGTTLLGSRNQTQTIK